MKSKIFMVIAVMAMMFIVINKSYSVCELKTGEKTRTVTAYYCDYGPGYCLKFQGNGDIWITIPGVLKTIQIKVPVNNVVPAPNQDYNEYCKFFLFTNNPSNDTGIGLIDGCLHFKDGQSEFYYYELDNQVTYVNYSEWELQSH